MGLRSPDHAAASARRDGATPVMLDWPATLARKGPRPLRPADLVWRAVPPEPACLHVIVLDASGSMLRRGRLARAKTVALLLVQRAARRDQHVALLLASGYGAQVLQPPAPARRALGVTVRAVRGGGGTPLTVALQRAETLAQAWARRFGGRARRVLWLLTDGQVRQEPPRPAFEVCVVVDADDDQPALGQARQWAHRWQAHHVALNDWN